MSKKLGEFNNITLTRFWGGERGVCYQITTPNEDGDINYVQLSREDIRHLFNIIMKDVLLKEIE